MSFGNQYTELDFTYPGTTLVNGENLDMNTPNGAGKTSIINALCYALYNKPFDAISLQRLINSTNASKNTLMEVRVVLEKGEDEYEIYRCRGENYTIQVLCNGDDITLDSVTENDKKVEELIGISYELFTKIIIYSGNALPFLLLPVALQRQQIEELFNITLLSEKAVHLKEKIRTTEGDSAIQTAVIKEQETAITVHQRHLREAAERVQRWDQDKISQGERIRNQLDSIKGIDFDDELQKHSTREEIGSLLQQLRIDMVPKDTERKNLKRDVEKMIREIDHLADNKCPYCMQKFADASSKISQLEGTITTRGEKLLALEDEVAKLSVDIEQLVTAQNEVDETIEHPNLKQLLEVRTNAEALRVKLDELENSPNPHAEAHEGLKVEAIREVDYSQLDSLKRRLEHQEFLLKLLTDKNSFIRRRIISRTIPFLNSRLNRYTQELGLPHVVKFDADMSCTVSEYGRELDFGNLSGGEKKRVNFALSMAFRDVLHHLHAKVNILFADEIDGGSIATDGIDAMTKLLKRKSRDEGMAVWIISHRPEVLGRYDRDIIVRKENGFSSIIYPESSH